jgi:hypothetical protein
VVLRIVHIAIKEIPKRQRYVPIVAVALFPLNPRAWMFLKAIANPKSGVNKTASFTEDGRGTQPRQPESRGPFNPVQRDH